MTKSEPASFNPPQQSHIRPNGQMFPIPFFQLPMMPPNFVAQPPPGFANFPRVQQPIRFPTIIPPFPGFNFPPPQNDVSKKFQEQVLSRIGPIPNNRAIDRSTEFSPSESSPDSINEASPLNIPVYPSDFCSDWMNDTDSFKRLPLNDLQRLKNEFRKMWKMKIADAVEHGNLKKSADLNEVREEVAEFAIQIAEMVRASCEHEFKTRLSSETEASIIESPDHINTVQPSTSKAYDNHVKVVHAEPPKTNINGRNVVELSKSNSAHSNVPDVTEEDFLDAVKKMDQLIADNQNPPDSLNKKHAEKLMSSTDRINITSKPEPNLDPLSDEQEKLAREYFSEFDF